MSKDKDLRRRDGAREESRFLAPRRSGEGAAEAGRVEPLAPLPVLCGARTAAEALGISRTTLLRWARNGRIPAVWKSPKRAHFDLRAVYAALREDSEAARRAAIEHYAFYRAGKTAAWRVVRQRKRRRRLAEHAEGLSDPALRRAWIEAANAVALEVERLADTLGADGIERAERIARRRRAWQQRRVREVWERAGSRPPRTRIERSKPAERKRPDPWR